jgi:hypothetical protein
MLGLDSKYQIERQIVWLERMRSCLFTAAIFHSVAHVLILQLSHCRESFGFSISTQTTTTIRDKQEQSKIHHVYSNIKASPVAKAPSPSQAAGALHGPPKLQNTIVVSILIGTVAMKKARLF